jgi:hypothetical protein
MANDMDNLSHESDNGSYRNKNARKPTESHDKASDDDYVVPAQQENHLAIVDIPVETAAGIRHEGSCDGAQHIAGCAIGHGAGHGEVDGVGKLLREAV